MLHYFGTKKRRLSLRFVIFFCKLLSHFDDFLQVRELANNIPFQNGTNKDVVKDIRSTIESYAVQLLERQQELDRPRYKTKWETELIGRENDIQAVWNMLVEEKKQFVTIVGIPGVGKTELALQIKGLAQQRDFTNVIFIPLMIKSSGEMQLLINNYLQTIDIEQLTLIILDGCEEITDKEMKKARKYIYNLVQRDTNLFILATSRVTFSAKEHKVKTLNVPDSVNEALTNLLKNDTIRLFLDEVKPIVTPNERNAQDMARFCIAVGGLPQSLKIAAPLVRLKGEEEIKNLLKQVENRSFLKIKNLLSDDPRQETLYALIETSYTRLAEDGYILEQKLLRRLSIFAGSCSITSLLAVCNIEGDLPTSEDDPDLINALNTLAFHNFIIFEKHHQISIAHATIRDFALEIMEDEEGEAILKQFVDYYYILVTNYMTEDDKMSNEEYKKLETLLREELYNVKKAWLEIHKIRDNYIFDELLKSFGQEEYDTFWTILKKHHPLIALPSDDPVRRWIFFLDRNVPKDEIETINRFNKAAKRIEKKTPYPLYNALVNFWIDEQARQYGIVFKRKGQNES